MRIEHEEGRLAEWETARCSAEGNRFESSTAASHGKQKLRRQKKPLHLGSRKNRQSQDRGE